MSPKKDLSMCISDPEIWPSGPVGHRNKSENQKARITEAWERESKSEDHRCPGARVESENQKREIKARNESENHRCPGARIKKRELKSENHRGPGARIKKRESQMPGSEDEKRESKARIKSEN